MRYSSKHKIQHIKLVADDVGEINTYGRVIVSTYIKDLTEWKHTDSYIKEIGKLPFRKGKFYSAYVKSDGCLACLVVKTVGRRYMKTYIFEGGIVDGLRGWTVCRMVLIEKDRYYV